MDPLAAAQCVNEHAVAVLAPEALATEIEQYCSYMAHLNKRPESVAGCFVQSWRRISGHALGLRQSIERSTACSFPDLIRLRELDVRRTEAHLEQIITLDTLLSQVAARNPQLSYYDTLKPENALEQLNRAHGFLQDALKQAQRFSDTLAAGSPPIKVETLIAISTAQQRFSWCHNRHPDRAEEWEENFAAYAEGSTASVPTWLNAVPTVENARPIDVKGAARRTFEAMTRAHQPRAAQPGSASRQTKIEPPTGSYTHEQCKAIRFDGVGQQRLLEKQAARLAELTSSVWEGCRATFLRGAASGINPDTTFGASEYANTEIERIAEKHGGFTPKIRRLSYLTLGLEGLSSGLLASQACRAQNERPMEDPVVVTPNLDGKGDTRSQILPEMPPQVSIPQMRDLIIETSERIARARKDLTDHCLTKPP
ncbi:hypothetical protein, partial [Roseovarius sp.]|uniref:hypothetical protein n=1 Tax=Roseovarius sp. TaxID=1486281 RepID=UPI003563DECD